jgi:hypothetical protein
MYRDFQSPGLLRQQKIPHQVAGDFDYSSTKLVGGSTELTSSGGDEEGGVGQDIANGEVS